MCVAGSRNCSIEDDDDDAKEGGRTAVAAESTGHKRVLKDFYYSGLSSAGWQ